MTMAALVEREMKKLEPAPYCYVPIERLRTHLAVTDAMIVALADAQVLVFARYDGPRAGRLTADLLVDGDDWFIGVARRRP